jgi:flavin-dependent dehydrogenase
MNSVDKAVISRRAPSEVTVIGGSAAGLFSAYLLAREGVKVRLFDSNDVMNMTPRTLIVTSGLRDALGFAPTDAIVNEITDIHLSSPNREARVSLRDPDLIVERAAIVKLLAQKALDVGVEICGKTRLLGLRPSQNGARATLRNTKTGEIVEVETQTLIGADGTSSMVGKIANSHALETVPLLQAIVQLPEAVPRNLTNVWFRPEDTPYFYWMIPHSNTEAAVGLIADDGKGAWDKLARFVERLGLKYTEIQGSRIPLYSKVACNSTRFAHSGVYFVGDAAAQVKVTTVGGLVTGLRGAKAAVGQILGNGCAKDSHELRRELDVHHKMRGVLNKFHSADYDRLVGMLNGRLRGLLAEYNRDQLVRFAFKLVFAQPRLLRFVSVLLR